MDHQNLSIFSPASPPAESIRTLSVLVFAITGLIFLVVEGVLIYLIVRSRRRAVDDTKEPPQLYGSRPIEIAWTAAPALIVFILALVTTRTLWEVRVGAPAPREGSPALFVTVVGHQWWWEYRYENYEGKSLGFVAANELHVPSSEGDAHRPVYLTLKSADVCHSFWVPRLAGQDRPDPRQGEHDVVPRRRSGASSSASAPSIAGPSTRTCSSGWSSTRRRISRAGPRINRSRRSRSRPRGRASSPSCRTVVRELPPGPGHSLGRGLCPGPDPPDEPRDAGRRDDPQHARGAPAMVRRPSIREAGVPDAGLRPGRPRPRRDPWLSRDAPLRDA